MCRGNIYAKFIPLLEGIHIVDFSFQFFDIKSRYKINCKLEGFNRVFWDEYVLSLANPNFEFRICMCMVDLDFCL